MRKLIIMLPLYVALIGFSAVNITMKMNAGFSGLPSDRLILSSPFSSSAHMRLASQLWEQGRGEEAKKELALANDLLPQNERAVLGAAISPADTLRDWENHPRVLERNYAYWTGVIKDKQDYRDAYVAAGTLAYELGNLTDAKRLLETALRIDPNFHVARDLLSSLKP